MNRSNIKIMNIPCKALLLAFGLLSWMSYSSKAQSVSPGSAKEPTENDTARSLAPFFKPATLLKQSPDADGFIRRWLLLEPINKSIRSNLVFTNDYLKTQFETNYFPDQFTGIPKNLDKENVGTQVLLWHALESPTFNVKLFRFAYGLKKQTYAVLFWAVTIINSPREVKNVRLAVGSNGGSTWWVNGEKAVVLDGDRRMVMDDCVSTRLTLKKGKNFIRGALINGPGLSDFCTRLIDENGEPVKNLTISLQ